MKLSLAVQRLFYLAMWREFLSDKDRVRSLHDKSTTYGPPAQGISKELRARNIDLDPRSVQAYLSRVHPDTMRTIEIPDTYKQAAREYAKKEQTKARLVSLFVNSVGNDFDWGTLAENVLVGAAWYDPELNGRVYDYERYFSRTKPKTWGEFFEKHTPDARIAPMIRASTGPYEITDSIARTLHAQGSSLIQAIAQRQVEEKLSPKEAQRNTLAELLATLTVPVQGDGPYSLVMQTPPHNPTQAQVLAALSKQEGMTETEYLTATVLYTLNQVGYNGRANKLADMCAHWDTPLGMSNTLHTFLRNVTYTRSLVTSRLINRDLTQLRSELGALLAMGVIKWSSVPPTLHPTLLEDILESTIVKSARDMSTKSSSHTDFVEDEGYAFQYEGKTWKPRQKVFSDQASFNLLLSLAERGAFM